MWAPKPSIRGVHRTVWRWDCTSFCTSTITMSSASIKNDIEDIPFGADDQDEMQLVNSLGLKGWYPMWFIELCWKSIGNVHFQWVHCRVRVSLLEFWVYAWYVVHLGSMIRLVQNFRISSWDWDYTARTWSELIPAEGSPQCRPILHTSLLGGHNSYTNFFVSLTVSSKN